MAILEIHNLVKNYVAPTGEELPVLDVPEFSMEIGEHVALLGESGSGKTTLLNIIAGILRADAGSVQVADVEMTRLREGRRDRVRARHIGYVFQTFNLLQGYTALENVELGMAFGVGVDRRWATHLLDRVGMADRMQYRPSQLSVGQQQRVAVARALANQPQLVLADEPTGNLDPRNAFAAMRLIREVCEENGAALLVVSHDERLIGGFDRQAKLAALNLAAGAAGTAERVAAGVGPAGDEWGEAPAAAGEEGGPGEAGGPSRQDEEGEGEGERAGRDEAQEGGSESTRQEDRT